MLCSVLSNKKLHYCRLYFGIRISNIALLFFKIFPIHTLCTFACVWTNCWSTFATLIEVPLKHAFSTPQPLLQVSKNVDLSFHFLRTSKSGLYGGWLMKSMFWVLNNAVVWTDMWELSLSRWRVIRLRRLVFPISWRTTAKQIVVYHSELTVLRCSSGTIAKCTVFPKKQVIICLEVVRVRPIFVGFGSS